MATATKRYYWIKLKENFFDLETIDWLISQKNGCEYIVLYQKLCLLTANKGGRLAMNIGEMIVPYDANKIARDTKFDIDTVIVAMELFKKIGLIYEEEDGILKIPYVSELVGSETSSAKRMRESRRKKALQSSTAQASQCDTNVTQEIEKDNREKILEIKDIDAEGETTAADYNEENTLKFFKGSVVMFTDAQLDDLLSKMDLEVFDEYVYRLENFITSNNCTIKNHYATILKWYNEDRGIVGG